ncbi:hypothetical protein PEBR_02572 [Penicillium brasilianum]|uniref:Uncharacterized protein n=1 Tax=Penicillium brasilianum TaxID=104259 RepID=A0A1S9RZ20_PENBI|nr:hypothetical protein PEBR_02572 [Penicillium brasilianum]
MDDPGPSKTFQLFCSPYASSDSDSGSNSETSDFDQESVTMSFTPIPDSNLESGSQNLGLCGAKSAVTPAQGQENPAKRFLLNSKQKSRPQFPSALLNAPAHSSQAP